MNIAQELELLKSRLAQAEIADVQVTEDELIVELTDGRVIATPLLWFPRLSYGTVAERSNFIVAQRSIHWPELDEDIGIETLLLGRGPGERPESFLRWLEERGKVCV
ncbi:MAG: DUF2442 domain-containing protein [Caldilinea sp.]|jgi:hypothetical protein|nr:DUF2442 domain-containing protein [Caldilinea sp.]